MPSLEGFAAALLGILTAGAAMGLFFLLRRTRVSPALEALERGCFAAALAAARTGSAAGRDDLYAAAVAAKHLLRMDEARASIDRVLAADPGDGEARLESGL